MPDTRDELPEVLTLVGQGWALAPDAPVWSFLPAVFPRTHRTWVRDRSTWYCQEWVDGVHRGRSVASDEDVADVYRLNADHAGRCGFPDWDSTRIWLLRTGNWLTVEQVVERVARAANRRLGGVVASPGLGQVAADVVARALGPAAARG